MPIADNSDEGIIKFFHSSFRFVKRAVQGGGNVLVHCFTGNKASLVMMIGYLMWE